MAYNITNLNSASTVKKILFFGIIIVCLIIINNLVRSIYDLWSKQDFVVKAQTDLEKANTENQELKRRLSLVKSDQFVEDEARDKLFLVKPGESGVIVPSELETNHKSEAKKVIPNWQSWLNLFLGN